MKSVSAQAALFGWPWPETAENIVPLAASLSGVSCAPAPRPGARTALVALSSLRYPIGTCAMAATGSIICRSDTPIP
jgi:hypothetical protein